MKNESAKKFYSPRKLAVMLGAFVICIMSLVTYAWLMQNRVVDNKDGMALKIRTYLDVTTTSCHALKYDGIEKAAVELIGNEGVSVMMTEYDRVFTDRNVNTPMIVRILVTELPEDIATDDTGRFVLNLPCFNSYMSGEKIVSSLSNVVVVKAGVGLGAEKALDSYGTDISNSGTSKIDIYQGAVASLNSGTPIQETFVEKNSGSYTTFGKNTNMTLTVPYSAYAGHIQQFADGEKAGENYLVLYVEFDYDDALIENYVQSYLGSSGDEMPLNFSADMGTIYIEFESNED